MLSFKLNLMQKFCQIIFIINITINISFAQVSVLSGNNGYVTTQTANKSNNVTSKIEILPNKDTVMVYKYMSDLHEELALGTPFFKNASFSNGIIFADGTQISGDFFYNIFEENIQFSTNNFETSSLLKPDSFVIGNRNFLKLDKLFINAYKSYYEEIYNDEYNQVFKRNTCNFIANNIQKTGYDKNDRSLIGKFVKSAEYYFVRVNRLERVKKNINFCKQLGLFQKDLEWFAETKKLIFDNDKDVIELMKYYNTLFNN